MTTCARGSSIGAVSSSTGVVVLDDDELEVPAVPFGVSIWASAGASATSGTIAMTSAASTAVRARDGAGRPGRCRRGTEARAGTGALTGTPSLAGGPSAMWRGLVPPVFRPAGPRLYAAGRARPERKRGTVTSVGAGDEAVTSS